MKKISIEMMTAVSSFASFVFYFSSVHFASAATTLLPNPVAASSIQQLIAMFLQAIVKILLPIIALAVVVSGFMFIAARGDTGLFGITLKQAKSNLGWTLFGALLILGAWVLATLIGNTVQQIVQ